MPSQTELPPEVMDLFDVLPESTRELALALRKKLLATLPDAIEVPDVKARVIGYGYGTGYKDMVATIILSKAGVKLGLVQGASLPDPDGLLAGTGKVHRYIAFRESAQIRKPAVKALLRASLAAWRKRTDGSA